MKSSQDGVGPTARGSDPRRDTGTHGWPSSAPRRRVAGDTAGSGITAPFPAAGPRVAAARVPPAGLPCTCHIPGGHPVWRWQPGRPSGLALRSSRYPADSPVRAELTAISTAGEHPAAVMRPCTGSSASRDRPGWPVQHLASARHQQVSHCVTTLAEVPWTRLRRRYRRSRPMV